MRALVLLAIAGAVLAGPVVAAVVAPQVLTQVAEQGFAVQHHHFLFDRTFTVHDHGQAFAVHVADADMYEEPLTTQLVVRGAVSPEPSLEQMKHAFQLAMDKYHLPILNYDVQRDGAGGMTVRATLPAGVLAELSPAYREKIAQYQDA